MNVKQLETTGMIFWRHDSWQHNSKHIVISTNVTTIM